MFRRIPPVIMIVLLLAIYGFLVTLFADPIKTLIIIALSVLLYVGISNYLRYGTFFPRSSNPSKKLNQPRPKAQQSYRYGAKKQSKPARKNHPFRVINGSKRKQEEKSSSEDSPNNLSQ
ncbi:hypothetical protein ACAF76_012710 [Brevibacillus sp. TJ4]|uniref:hypothetical protein n=1 Tax=Brevibacillus sp. TJ4 TaxID=3234853 RepID=UPI0037D1D932